MTYTFALLAVSQAAYDEVKEKLTATGYGHTIGTTASGHERIDMHGLALICTSSDEDAEDRSEIARHHRDFEKIREIVHTALAVDSAGEAVRALRDIRNIVG